MMKQNGREQGTQPKETAKKFVPLISEETLRQIYAAMLRCKMLQERLRKRRLSRSAPAGVLLCAEPEAILAGSAIGLRPADAIALLQGDAAAVAHLRGAPLRDVLAQASTRPPANTGAHNLLPVASSQVLSTEALLHLSLGVAWANARQKDANAVAVYLEGAKTPLHALDAALRYASTHKLPILFVCVTQGNTTPLRSSSRRQTQTVDIHVRAHTSGVPGIPVDGADAVAIYRVAHEALQRARNGGGPTLMEAKILSDRRRASERAAASPLAVMRRYMEQRGLFDPAWEKKIAAAFTRDLDKAAASLAATRRKTAAKKRRG
jgi:TPP-dependent pyruvate/acetoin dehydrogenase alpha subunit